MILSLIATAAAQDVSAQAGGHLKTFFVATFPYEELDELSFAFAQLAQLDPGVSDEAMVVTAGPTGQGVLNGRLNLRALSLIHI